MSPSLRWLIGRSLQALGRFTEAAEEADGCLDEVATTPVLPDREQVRTQCERLRDDLSQRVGRVTVRVAQAPDGLQVQVAGDLLARERLGRPVVVAPGAVVIHATAPGHLTFHREVALAAGARAVIDVTLAEAAPSLPVRALPPPLPPQPIPSAPSVVRRGPGVGPWVVVGAGAALVGTSLVLFVLRNGAIDDWHAACDHQPDCPESARPLYDRADSLNTWTAVTAITGGVVVGAGLAWFLFSPREVSSARSITPAVSGTWIGIRGVF